MSKKIIAHSNYIDKLLEVVHPERDSRFALVIVNRETKEVDERFISPRQIHKFIPYCRFRNSQGGVRRYSETDAPDPNQNPRST